MNKPKYEIGQTVYSRSGELINPTMLKWVIKGVEKSDYGYFVYKVYGERRNDSIEESRLRLSEDELFVIVIEALEEKLKEIRETRIRLLIKNELEREGVTE